MRIFTKHALIGKIHFTALLLIGTFLLISSSGGKDGNWAAAPDDDGTCASCHTTGFPTGGSIVLTGVPAAFTPGVTYPLTLTISDADAVVGGFQIVASNNSTGFQVGEFSTPSGTRLNDVDRLVHNLPKSFSGGSVSWSFNWTAPTSGLPPSVVFFYAGNAANGNGNTTLDEGFNGSSAAVPLPVELTRFEAKAEKNSVLLEWETAVERDAANFIIWRSNDGRHFDPIQEIDAKGNTTGPSHYSFTDTQLPKTRNVYYQLEQKDTDGKRSISKIVAVQNNSATTTVHLLNGNPVWNGLGTVAFKLDTDLSAQYARLYRMDGQIMGETPINESGFVEIKTPHTMPGLYFLQIFDESNHLIHTEKVIVK